MSLQPYYATTHLSCHLSMNFSLCVHRRAWTEKCVYPLCGVHRLRRGTTVRWIAGWALMTTSLGSAGHSYSRRNNRRQHRNQVRHNRGGSGDQRKHRLIEALTRGPFFSARLSRRRIHELWPRSTFCSDCSVQPSLLCSPTHAGSKYLHPSWANAIHSSPRPPPPLGWDTLCHKPWLY